ncbi:hypothetical protein K2F54_15165 [Cryobacterium sp. 1639]|uniref:hypothetical protein n=1 Tax=Cryobacterium inferilacus TaxID=2866629 RepID=UPI001C72CD17|nr:hypothetical protein [Cryobacterium sp. 1639]MBX0301312.1 hypothetical protein [Cryobacterium sp. 1639]
MNDRDPESSAIPNSELTRRDETLWKAEVSRRGTLTAAAWAVPVIAMAAATPAAVASGEFNLQADLRVAPLGGAEGRYNTGSNYNAGGSANPTDFRRAFVIQNVGEGTFTGTLRVNFSFPRMWNQATGNNTSAFNNWGTKDVFASGSGTLFSPANVSGWNTPVNHSTYVQNVKGSGTGAAWEQVWLLLADTYFTMSGTLAPGGSVTFALNANIPNAWISGVNGDNSYLPGWIYWRSPVTIQATTSGGENLGTYDTGVGAWNNGIWYFNGGGPWGYLPSPPYDAYGLYPSAGQG